MNHTPPSETLTLPHKHTPTEQLTEPVDRDVFEFDFFKLEY